MNGPLKALFFQPVFKMTVKFVTSSRTKAKKLRNASVTICLVPCLQLVPFFGVPYLGARQCRRYGICPTWPTPCFFFLSCACPSPKLLSLAIFFLLSSECYFVCFGVLCLRCLKYILYVFTRMRMLTQKRS